LDTNWKKEMLFILIFVLAFGSKALGEGW